MVKFFYLPSIADCVPKAAKQRVIDPEQLFHQYHQPRLGLYVELYILRDKYDIRRLREDAREWVELVLKEYDADEDIEDMVDSIERIYTSTPQSNRDLKYHILKGTTFHQRTIVSDAVFGPKYRDILERVPEYALDVALWFLNMN